MFAYRGLLLSFALPASISIPLIGASAQDFNVETFADQIAPPPSVEAPRPIVKEEIVKETQVVRKKVEKPAATVDKEIDEYRSEHPEAFAKTLGETITELRDAKQLKPSVETFAAREPSAVLSVLSVDQRRLVLSKLPGRSGYEYRTSERTTYVRKQTVKPPKTTVTASVTSSYAFDSNVFQKRSGAIADGYYSVEPAVTLRVPTSNTAGFTFSVSSTSARYDEQTTRDTDILSVGVGYAKVVSSVPVAQGSGTRREEQVKIAFNNQNLYDPGYKGSGIHIYSPVIGWQLNGIPVGTDLCGKKGSMVNCFVAGVGIDLSRKWIGSSGPGKNTGIKLGATLDWQIRGSALVWGWAGSVTDRYYEDYPGDRNDVFFSASTKVTWKPSDSVTVSAKAEYSKQFSSETPLEYDKYVVVPSVNASVKF